MQTSPFPLQYKRCAKNSGCLDPDGPVLPISRFSGSRPNHTRWCKTCRADYDIMRKKNRQAHVLIHGPVIIDTTAFKLCSNGVECVDPNGPNQPLSNYYKTIYNKDGLDYRCKACCAAYGKEYNKNKAPKPKKISKAMRLFSEGLFQCYRRNSCKNPKGSVLPLEEFSKDKTTKYGVSRQCKTCTAHYHKENRSRILETAVLWRKNNPNKIAVHTHNYRARKENLPSTLTEVAFEFCLSWWKHTCAYCGATNKKLVREHFIPLTDKRTDNPGTSPTNIVPACKSCNSSKHDLEPITWVTRKFGEAAANEILTKIHQYFAALV